MLNVLTERAAAHVVGTKAETSERTITIRIVNWVLLLCVTASATIMALAIYGLVDIVLRFV
jgi:hypothetical protein